MEIMIRNMGEKISMCDMTNYRCNIMCYICSFRTLTMNTHAAFVNVQQMKYVIGSGKIYIWNNMQKNTPKNHKIMKKHQEKKEEKNIIFGRLKINTELPVQRWWFKSTPKLRTVIFFNVSSLFITSIGAYV